MAKRIEMVNYLDKLLASTIEDTSSNGLQVQGTEHISRVGLAVDACLEAYRKAIALNCQMLIVHHGLIWNGIKYVTGNNHQHLKFLLSHDLNLYAAHLPLDMHPKYGNNIQLAKLLHLNKIQPFGVYSKQKIGYNGLLPQPKNLAEIAKIYQKSIGGKYTMLPFGKDKIRTVGIISGGAAEDLGQAIEAQLDLYITGESLHYNYHQAKEAKINVLYLGHYESEKLGVTALGNLLEKQFKVSCAFLDVPTIV
ncbi:MAG: Nif3-like dinuclear metal center hexameric protein [bacterium]